MREIKLTRGYFAFVDDGDYERINAFNWFANVNSYQVRATRQSMRQMIYMHHEVLGIMPWDLEGKEIDHIDRNPLNNQKSNLRIVSHTDNMRNTSRHLNRVGYSYNWRSRSYMCYLDEPGRKRKYLGYRKSEEEARILVEAARNANN